MFVWCRTGSTRSGGGRPPGGRGEFGLKSASNTRWRKLRCTRQLVTDGCCDPAGSRLRDSVSVILTLTIVGRVASWFRPSSTSSCRPRRPASRTPRPPWRGHVQRVSSLSACPAVRASLSATEAGRATGTRLPGWQSRRPQPRPSLPECSSCADSTLISSRTSDRATNRFGMLATTRIKQRSSHGALAGQDEDEDEQTDPRGECGVPDDALGLTAAVQQPCSATCCSSASRACSDATHASSTSRRSGSVPSSSTCGLPPRRMKQAIVVLASAERSATTLVL